MKFDVVVGNPPYLSGVWIKFIEKSVLSADFCAIVSPSAKIDVSAKYARFREFLSEKGIQEIRDCHSYFPSVVTSTPISYYLIDRNKPANSAVFGKEDSIISRICEKVLSRTAITGGLQQVAGQHGHKDKNAVGSIKTIMSIAQSGATIEEKAKNEVRIIKNAQNYFFVNQIIGRDANSYIFETTDSEIGIHSTVFVIAKPVGYDSKKFKEVYLSKLMRGVLATFRGTRITQGWQLARMPIVPSSVIDLYAHFGLTQEEIDYIEAAIK